jgi:hypothetical protein
LSHEAIGLLALHRSVERAEIIAQSRLPAPLLALRDPLWEHDRAGAGRAFVAVLRLLLSFPSEVARRRRDSAHSAIRARFAAALTATKTREIIGV